MNALIDVTLVLSIFFIMTTSYAAMQKLLDLPNYTIDSKSRIPKVKNETINLLMIRAVIRKGPDGNAIFSVGNEETEKKDLVNVLRQYYVETKKTEFLLDCADEV